MSNIAGRVPRFRKVLVGRIRPTLRPSSWLLKTAALSVLGFALFGAWAYWRCGSLDAGLAYLGGERVVADATAKNFGTVPAGQDPTVIFRIRNLGDAPVDLLGVEASCSCMLAKGLPTRIPPRGWGAFEVRVRTAKKSGRVAESLRCFTNSSDRREIVLRVSGWVTRPSRG